MADKKLSKADKQVVKDEADATVRDAATSKAATKAQSAADLEVQKSHCWAEGVPYEGKA